MAKSALTQLFLDEACKEQANNHNGRVTLSPAVSRKEDEREYNKKRGDTGVGVGGSFFQMPLHYPRYKRKDYEEMPEERLDRLLAEYGLPGGGNLGDKRQLAMGTFLWLEADRDKRQSCASSTRGCCRTS